jgi:phage gp36-like protein
MYCVIADISKILGGDVILSEFSSDANPPVINTELLDEIISGKSGYIDGFLRSRYSLPLLNSYPVLREICVTLSIYELSKRRNKETLYYENYKLAIKDLERMQSGDILLNENIGTSNDTDIIRSNPRAKYFTDEILSIFD